MADITQQILKDISILVIDDKELNSSILDLQLKTAGREALFAKRASQAIQIIKRAKIAGTPIQIIISDFHLPDMNGIEFLRELNSFQDPSETNLIFLTNQDLGEQTKDLAAMGVRHILRQPSSTDSLIEAISDSLQKEVEDKPKYSNKRDIRILAADDDAINLAVLKGFLSLAGYSIDTVMDGVDAVKACENIDYDLVLMDICMPIMDGVIATLQIRTNEKRANRAPVPIVAVTAHFSPSQKKRYLEAGMNDVMSKPIRKDLIDACLKEWCTRFPEGEVHQSLRAANG